MSNFCSNCGSELREGQTFCSQCGAQVSNQVETVNVIPTHQAYQQMEKDSNATSSLVFGIVGLFVFGLILGIVAIIEANASKNKNGGVYSSKAKAGLILGIIDVSVMGLYFLVTISSL